MRSKVFCVGLMFIILISSSQAFSDRASTLLNIPPREQWTNYCGSTSIQMAGLYYGMYVSQDIVRKTVRDEEVLLGINCEEALGALSLRYRSWDYEDRDVESYCQWMKESIRRETPVIFTTMVAEESSSGSYYDHIMLAMGFVAEDPATYDDSDTLIYNDCFEEAHLYQSFETFRDSSAYYYLNPDWHYGIEVTGIEDEDNICLPVRVSVDRWNEPDLTQGELPVLLNAVIQVGSLEIGNSYLLLRYDDPTDVPSGNFVQSSSDLRLPFTAEAETATFSDTFSSDGVAIYRCAPASKPSAVSPASWGEIKAMLR